MSALRRFEAENKDLRGENDDLRRRLVERERLVAAKLRSIDEALRLRHSDAAGSDNEGVRGHGGGDGAALVKGIISGGASSDANRSELAKLLRLARTPARKKKMHGAEAWRQPATTRGAGSGSHHGVEGVAGGSQRGREATHGAGSMRAGRGGGAASPGRLHAEDAGGGSGSSLQEDVARLMRPTVRIRRCGVDVQQ